MKLAIETMRQMSGSKLIRLIKRTHYIKEMNTIRNGLPSDKINRIVKCIKYSLYWEFDSNENYGKAQNQLYNSFWKSIEKCLLVPHDKILGDVII